MFPSKNQAQGEITCEPPPPLSDANATWRRGSTVNLYIDPLFGDGQDVIAHQIELWNAGTNFFVNFRVKSLSEMGGGALFGFTTTWYIFQTDINRTSGVRPRESVSTRAIR
jgi:hypothetical protein